MRSRDESGGAILWPEFIDHQDETEHRPALVVRREIGVKRLRRSAGHHRPAEQGAELERLPDYRLCGREERPAREDMVEVTSRLEQAVQAQIRSIARAGRGGGRGEGQVIGSDGSSQFLPVESTRDDRISAAQKL